ncbi:uncharacterized protein LOC112692804 isoform X2 [Sipha flava]|nr:uncharacterized protein LOC112692804 isoform X2 [Sipha flava]
MIGTFHHPTQASKARGIPEMGKLPKTSASSKKLPAGGTVKFTTTGNNRSLRNSHISAKDGYQLSKPHSNHIRLEDLHQKSRPQISNDERAEKVNSDLEKMIQFMTVLGQVDRYLSARAKSFISTLGRAMDNSLDDRQFYNDKEMSSYDY